MIIEKVAFTDGKVTIISDGESPTVEIKIESRWAARGWARLDNINIARARNESGHSYPSVLVSAGEVAITGCQISNRYGAGVQVSGPSSRVALGGGFLEECETYGLVCKNGGHGIACGLEREYEQEGPPDHLVDKDMMLNRRLMDIQKIVDIIDNGGLYQVPPPSIYSNNER